jgi:hypothetical protein
VDHFCQQLDNSSSGILATLSRLSDLLKVNDEQLWHHLEFTTKVETFQHFYSSACTVQFYLKLMPYNFMNRLNHNSTHSGGLHCYSRKSSNSSLF